MRAGVLPKGSEAHDPQQLLDPRVASLERADIRRVRLYRLSSSLVRFCHASVAAAGKATGPLAYTDLLPFDQHHYGGVAAVDDAARRCGDGVRSSVSMCAWASIFSCTKSWCDEVSARMLRTCDAAAAVAQRSGRARLQRRLESGSAHAQLELRARQAPRAGGGRRAVRLRHDAVHYCAPGDRKSEFTELVLS